MIQVEPMRHKDTFDGKDHRPRLFIARLEFGVGGAGSHFATPWHLT